MMLRSINKKKIYFYLLVLFFLSTSLNLNIISTLKSSNLVKNIEIKGIEGKEKQLLSEELKQFKNQNIFIIDKNQIFKILNLFNFIDYFYIKKILPSKLIVSVKKTEFFGLTIIDGKKYYVGKNKKFISVTKVEHEKDLPLIFGNFKPSEFLDLQKKLEQENINLLNIKKYYFHKNKRWDFKDDKKIVMLPQENVNQALKLYKSLIDENKLNLIKIVDLRIPNKIILTDE